MRPLPNDQTTRSRALGIVLCYHCVWKAAWTADASKRRHDNAVGEVHVSESEGGEEFVVLAVFWGELEGTHIEDGDEAFSDLLVVGIKVGNGR